MTTTAVLGSNQWVLSDDRLKSFVIAGAVVVIAAFALAKLTKKPDDVTSRWFIADLVGGADGRASTSKFQAVLWTALAVFGFVEVFVERLWLGTSSGDTTIPTNMLVAMGFSVTTMATAKGITVAYTAKSLVDKSATKVGTATTLLGGLATDDDGAPDLSKIQMLAFTTIAAVVYLLRMALPDKVPWTPEQVDIEPSLMVMMGLSQGAYLGKKLTTTEAPRLVGVSPTMGNATTPIVLTGAGFGDLQDGSVVLFGEMPATVTSWANSRIELKAPIERLPGVAWKDGDRVAVSTIANGHQTTALAQFVFKA